MNKNDSNIIELIHLNYAKNKSHLNNTNGRSIASEDSLFELSEEQIALGRKPDQDQ
ncbi:MAG TPA: hypothetical protein VE818_00410 [Nitrososphaeraceae archaeon]|nr:hypothetical protein [Nitrososphaeraceae archaeon]